MKWNTYTDDLEIPTGWECTSYGNDELPSYQANGYHIWMDSHHMSERLINSKNIYGKNEVQPRFSVINADIYNMVSSHVEYHPDDYNDNLLNTDDFNEVIEFINKYEIVLFGFEDVRGPYRGFAKKSELREDKYWNGWLIPYVTKEVKERIVKSLDLTNSEIWDKDSQEEFKLYTSQPPNKEGLYCVGWGLCWDELNEREVI
tara:strand:+ start:99 stop:704 length:606 start_codon:yes stop_codon:yes gene_type:complete